MRRHNVDCVSLLSAVEKARGSRQPDFSIRGAQWSSRSALLALRAEAGRYGKKDSARIQFCHSIVSEAPIYSEARFPDCRFASVVGGRFGAVLLPGKEWKVFFASAGSAA